MRPLQNNLLFRPCTNGGTCMFSNETNNIQYKCLCVNGFTGDTCQNGKV